MKICNKEKKLKLFSWNIRHWWHICTGQNGSWKTLQDQSPLKLENECCYKRDFKRAWASPPQLWFFTVYAGVDVGGRAVGYLSTDHQRNMNHQLSLPGSSWLYGDPWGSCLEVVVRAYTWPCFPIMLQESRLQSPECVLLQRRCKRKMSFLYRV